MSLDKVALFAKSVGEYALARKLDCINVLFHGGEPLLLGAKYLEEAVQIISRNIPTNCKPVFSLQSNAALLDQNIVEALSRSDISISVSLDGGESAQDRHRVFADGSSSFDIVTRNIRAFLLDHNKAHIYKGILAVIDLRDDPIRTFDFLSDMTNSGVDFLFPDGSHDNPPPGISKQDFRTNSNYANWLIPIFDKWFNRGIRKPSVRFFENILTLLVGGRSNVEGVGEQCLSLLTIETDGEIQDSDILSVAFEHAARFGRGVYLGNCSFNKLIDSEMFRKQEALYSSSAINIECKGCYWRDICGGGLLPHRYGGDRNFDNPSIYCGNLKTLISHIREKLIGLVSSSLSTTSGLHSSRRINYMDRVSDYLQNWDFSLESHDECLHIVKGSEGNISASAQLDEPTATSLTPTHPKFFECIEKGVRDLVTVLVEDLSCITYSSCQGHQLRDGSWIRPRNVGILCRDQAEHLFLRDFLGKVIAESGLAQPRILSDWLESEEGVFRTVEIIFEVDPSDPAKYASSIERDYRNFVENLKGACFLQFNFKNGNVPSVEPVSVKIKRKLGKIVNMDDSFSGEKVLSLKFDEKTSHRLVYAGKVVMSATEKPYLQILLSQFENMRLRTVLEVGFGLGISAKIIQKIIRPSETHDIIEIESSLFRDLCLFSRQYPIVKPIYGNCYEYKFRRTYDFLFFDPYDYGLSDVRTSDEKELMEFYQTKEAALAYGLLNTGGILCHPFFGDINMPEIPGFDLKNCGTAEVPGVLLWDGTTCETAQIGYYVKRGRVSSS